MRVLLVAAVALLVHACTREPVESDDIEQSSAGSHELPESDRESDSVYPDPEQRIDVEGHLALAARVDASPLRGVWHWGPVPVGVTVGPEGTVFWAQYRTNTIERADRDGERVGTIAEVDGPLGVAFDQARDQLFYVTDRHYPRSIGMLQLGEKPKALIQGTDVNRPFAITVAQKSGKLFWTEAINGRIRSIDIGSPEIRTIFDDGIMNVGEAADVVALTPAGITVDEQRGWVFWSDLRTATITRARLDGSERETILRREHGLDLPTGLAFDASAGKLYWADPGSESIRRSDPDGSNVDVVAGTADGVLEPYGLAIDATHRLLYWSDLGRNALYRANLSDGRVERFANLSRPDVATPVSDTCGESTDVARREFLRRWVKSVRTCVIAVSATKAVMRTPSELGEAARTCRRQLQLVDEIAAFRAAVAGTCDAAQQAAALEDSIQLGAQILAADLPRTGDYLRAIRPFVARDGGQAATDATAAIDDLVPRLRRVAARAGVERATGVPASGQTTSFHAFTQAAGHAVAVPDDGAVRAGDPLTFRDNGDGTISDLTTGLMWEKKCDGCGGRHDVDARYFWRPDEAEKGVSAWLQEINSEKSTGFAGHDDWRLPGIGELLSIIDFERFNPAVTPDFDGPGCGFGCGSLGSQPCSCTNLGPYWTHGNLPRPDDVVPVVAFNLGVVFGQATDGDAFVRAVRGPVADREGRFVDNGDGTVTDRVTKLMWEKKCLRPGDLHDVDRALYWSFDGKAETIWDWVAVVNREGGRGFAGHDDWRIPNVKELFSLFDGRHRDPSIDPAFAGEGCADLIDPRCSLTADGPYWTSTTFADFPAAALAVGFSTPGELEDEPPPWVIRVVGGVEPHQKTLRMVVRAVRGPKSIEPAGG